jgi:hypothetical protein
VLRGLAEMNGAGIGIGKILRAFRSEAMEMSQPAMDDLPDSALRRPHKHLENELQLWMAKSYPSTLKELSRWHEWRGLPKSEREGRADSYLCGYWRGLHDALFIVYVQDCQKGASKHETI